MTTEITTQQNQATSLLQNEFELMQRKAKLLSSSTLVPKDYQANTTQGLANCFIALDMSQRMNANPLMVMQNLYIVHGKPAWSSQWIIAAINNCGKFSPLRFELKELEEIEVNKVKIRNKQCIAWVLEKETGERLESPIVSIDMAIKEGWYAKSGSKWQRMPDVMLRYRCASFFGKLYTPELLMGIQTVEEVKDIIDVTPIKEVQQINSLTELIAEDEAPRIEEPQITKSMGAGIVSMENVMQAVADGKLNLSNESVIIEANVDAFKDVPKPETRVRIPQETKLIDELKELIKVKELQAEYAEEIKTNFDSRSFGELAKLKKEISLK